MHFTKMFLALLVATLATPGICAHAQAHVTENQSTYIYVDAQYGSDGNAGTQFKPLKTIQAAVDKAKLNNTKWIGTKVLINPGIYREFVDVQQSYNQTTVPMTFEAAQTGTAVIAGSDVLTNWYQTMSNPSIYTHSWTYNFGSCGVPSGWPSGIASIILRREMIFVNNVPLTQVMSLSQIRSGTFYVDEGANQLHIWPSSATNMATAVVEAAVRPQTMNVIGRTNVVFRGLVFRHAANCINEDGAVVTNTTNVLFDKVQANWNNWGGLGINSSSEITIQNSVASHNGGLGFGGKADRYTLLNFNESDYNNWRGAMGALYDWGMGGTKFLLMHTATVTNHFSYRNQAQGLWFDTDNKNVSISNATLSENVLASLQLEANEGPISLTSSALCSSGVGLNIINMAELTLKNNTFYNNGRLNKYQAQIYLAGKAGGRQVTDWETGQTYYVYTSDTTMDSNSFEDARPGQYVFSTYLSGNDWSAFTSSLSSNYNHWYDRSTSKPFKMTGGKLIDLPGWQYNTREDLASSWTSATSLYACTVPPPSFTDFSVNTDNRAYQMVYGKGTVNLEVNSFGYGTVSLATSGLPSGVTATYAQSSLTSGVTQLTLSAASWAARQTVPITIFANSGSRVHSVTVSVAVTPGA